MSSAVAFFPWVSCREPIELGAARILPYAHGALPGDLPNATQADIDGVIGAYANRPNHPVKYATLLEIAGWSTGTEAGDHVKALFRTREAIAFAAISKRHLFRGHFDYCNADTYSLVVQRYQPGATGTFSFNTRRRDTGTSHMWSSDEFAFHRPNHVGRSEFDVDRPLLKALLALGDSSPSLAEAVREFNAANTDSSDVPEHVELVMTKSAFEWLLEIDTGVSEFVAALDARLSPVLTIERVTGELADKWRTRWPKAKRPLEAWARDFCDRRGAAAHGLREAAERFVWPERVHLAFASILFPLVFKQRLADDGRLTLDTFDLERLKAIEELLMVNPLSKEAQKDEHAHPWAEFQSFAFMRARADRFFKD